MAKIERTRKINIPIIAACILFYLTLVSVCLTSGLYARYIVSDSASDKARVATFCFDETMKSQVHQQLIADMYPGATQTYTFTVSNTSNTSGNSEVCEVDLAYQFEVSTENNLPLKYTITGENTWDTGTLVSHVLNTSRWDGGQMSASEGALHTYTLTVTWDASEMDHTYSEEMDMIVITLTAEQID